ncbi:MAG: hypothetical protein LBT51_01755 [Fusobacteriaceae bacterium]|jgi:hypothetical protein|nr:hypothetical protein [Fusobacteriaceae bacterium]
MTYLEVNQYINIIKGEPLIEIYRIADMVSICFGDKVKLVSSDDKEILRENFSIKLFPNWRMIDLEQIKF